ncbi:hypothetical protein [uncultured Psychroserpens sp.]|uniref:hypothetical protein n=1 Tax=uncultured Psychroserpens sp. TaxID=255436 RepID=UPI0026224870|nr:hypothetical protein [uncultured Psychroserpens sp.]
MTILEQLAYHENDQLEEWLDLDDKTQKRFHKDLIKFAKSNPDEFKNYCINTIPTEFSSLSIVYTALTEYSTAWNDFLFEEIKRVVTLAKNNKIKAEYLEVLEDIECEDIYSKDEDIYIEIINFLIAQLSTSNDKAFNLHLLEIIDWYLIEYDEEADDIAEVSVWISSLRNIANNSTHSSVREAATEAMGNLDESITSSSGSLLDKIKSFFFN